MAEREGVRFALGLYKGPPIHRTTGNTFGNRAGNHAAAIYSQTYLTEPNKANLHSGLGCGGGPATNTMKVVPDEYLSRCKQRPTNRPANA